MSRRILTVDDDPATTGAFKRLLEFHGYIVREENDSTRALAATKEFQPDVVILDFLMPVAHGGDVAWQIASDGSLQHIKIVVCSGAGSDQFKRRLPPTRIAILKKPVDPEALLELLAES